MHKGPSPFAGRGCRGSAEASALPDGVRGEPNSPRSQSNRDEVGAHPNREGLAPRESLGSRGRNAPWSMGSTGSADGSLGRPERFRVSGHEGPDWRVSGASTLTRSAPSGGSPWPCGIGHLSGLEYRHCVVRPPDSVRRLPTACHRGDRQQWELLRLPSVGPAFGAMEARSLSADRARCGRHRPGPASDAQLDRIPQ